MATSIDDIINIIEHPTLADGITSNLGWVKPIENPYYDPNNPNSIATGEKYIAVFTIVDCSTNNIDNLQCNPYGLTTCVGTSNDLLNWTQKSIIDNKSYANPTPYSHQATQASIIATSDGGFIIAEDLVCTPMRLRYYPSYNNLMSGTSSKLYDIPNMQGQPGFPSQIACYGSPNIYSVSFSPNSPNSPNIDNSTIDVGYHYWDCEGTCKNDRQGRGTVTNFNSFNPYPQPEIDNAIINLGYPEIGQRDNFIATTNNNTSSPTNTNQYIILEANPTTNAGNPDWNKWRLFIYDFTTKTARKLNITTDHPELDDTTGFNMPRISILSGPNGNPAVYVSMILSGAQTNSLSYYKYLPTSTNNTAALLILAGITATGLLYFHSKNSKNKPKPHRK